MMSSTSHQVIQGPVRWSPQAASNLMRGNSLTQEQAEAMWLRLTAGAAPGQRFAAGGIVPDVSCSDDSVPAFLQGCDYIIPAALAERLSDEFGREPSRSQLRRIAETEG